MLTMTMCQGYAYDMSRHLKVRGYWQRPIPLGVAQMAGALGNESTT